MCSDTVLISAPYAARSSPSSLYPWTDYVSFQPLLGFDAQMAGFVALVGNLLPQISCLAAPEIAPASRLLALAGSSSNKGSLPIHVRFGPLRTCRLCKGARNIAILAENETAVPLRLGLHPFATGTVAPQGLSMALSYEQRHITPRRIDGSRLPVEILPAVMAGTDLPEPPEGRNPPIVSAKEWPADLIMQCRNEFAARDWLRRPGGFSQDADKPAEPASPCPDVPCVLVPWNLAHAGSLVPDLLEKAETLGERSPCPVKLLVFPYNDEPEGLRQFMLLAAANRTLERAGATPDQAVVFVRALTVRAGISLVRRCKRAWIDGTDPEAGWTMLRLRRLGIPVNVVSMVGAQHPEEDRPNRFAADEEACVRLGGPSGPLAWRCRTLSLRRLSALMQAIMHDVDDPLPASAEAPNESEAERMAATLSVLDLLADG